MKASDLFVQCLEEEKIEYIFGVPGEENADFMMSLEQSKKIQFILTRHEQGAAFMAEAYGRLTGNPAGCIGDIGAGRDEPDHGCRRLEHGPRADARADRTGRDGSRLHKESHQIMDVVSMFTSPSPNGRTPSCIPDTIPEIVRKAVRHCAHGKTRAPCTSSCRRTSPSRMRTSRRSADTGAQVPPAGAG